MQRNRTAILFALAAACTSCNEGKKIEAVENAVRDQLRDPSSAVFTHVKIVGGNIVCGEVNSKNGFGGYAGRQRFVGTAGEGSAQATIISGEGDDGSSSVCDTYTQAANAVAAEDQRAAVKK